MAASFAHLMTSNTRIPFLCRNNLHRLSSSQTSANMAPSKQSYWASINADIAAHLQRCLAKRAPLAVHEPLQDLVFAAPKTMAPDLCIAACELVGGDRSDAVAAAAAINLLHSASYTHEGLPYLLERPKSAAFGANVELLTGDSISPLGFELLARSDSGNSDRILRVIVEIASAIGAQGMVEGQYMHVKWAKGEDSGNETIRHVCEKKEGGLHACGAACGAILGGASEEEIEKLRRYGLYIGMIYGILYGIGREEKNRLEIAQELRSMALQELEGFECERVREISSLVDVCFGLTV